MYREANFSILKQIDKIITQTYSIRKVRKNNKLRHAYMLLIKTIKISKYI